MGTERGEGRRRSSPPPRAPGMHGALDRLVQATQADETRELGQLEDQRGGRAGAARSGGSGQEEVEGQHGDEVGQHPSGGVAPQDLFWSAG